MFTAWWTAYGIQSEYQRWVEKGELRPNPFLYFIQDYEPGFYPWSSRYMLADSTDRCEFRQIAIFNSHELRQFFDEKGYEFYQSYEFPPLLNDGLKKARCV